MEPTRRVTTTYRPNRAAHFRAYYTTPVVTDEQVQQCVVRAKAEKARRPDHDLRVVADGVCVYDSRRD